MLAEMAHERGLAIGLKNRHWMLFRVAAATGMRRGELRGLRWSDVHLDTGRVELPQPLAAVGYTTMFSRLKTKTGRRCITLESGTVRHLKTWQKQQATLLAVQRPQSRAPGNLRIGTAMIASGARVLRGQAVMRAIERRHPQEPHWYLAVLGTEPAHRARVSARRWSATFSRPCQCWRARVSGDRGQCAFYERHGFRVVGELDVPGGGPRLWLMWHDLHEPS